MVIDAVAVVRIQGDGAIIVTAPGAAVTVRIKAEVIHQLVAEAARVRAASGVGGGVRPVDEAGADQVVPHHVEFHQGMNLNEAVAIGISDPLGGQAQPGHRAEAAVFPLDGHEDGVGGAGHQVSQADAGPGAGRQRLAGGGYCPSVGAGCGKGFLDVSGSGQLYICRWGAIRQDQQVGGAGGDSWVIHACGTG